MPVLEIEDNDRPMVCQSHKQVLKSVILKDIICADILNLKESNFDKETKLSNNWPVQLLFNLNDFQGNC